MPMIRLYGPTQMEYARRALAAAPKGAVVTIKKPTRSLEQNAKMWAMLHDIKQHMGYPLTADQWKAAFMTDLGHEIETFQHPDTGELIPTGHRTSRMSPGQMSDLIELMYKYGVEKGVVWKEAARGGHMAGAA